MTSTQSFDAAAQTPPITAVPADAVESTTTSPFQLQQELQQLVARELSLSRFLDGLFKIQLRRSEVVGCATLHFSENGRVTIGAQSHQNSISQVEWLESIGQRVANDRTMLVARDPDESDRIAICIPVNAGPVIVLATLIDQRSTAARLSTEIALAQLCAAQLNSWSDRRRTADLSCELHATAAILELVGRVEAAVSTSAAGFAIVTAVQEFLHCERVVIALRGKRANCNVLAMSGVASVDHASESTRQLQAMLDECVLRDQVSSWPPIPGGAAHQLLAHKQIARRDAAVISVPLKAPDGTTIGAMAALGRREFVGFPQIVSFLVAAQEPLGAALDTARRLEGNRLQRCARWLLSRSHRQRRWIALGIVTLTGAAMLIPIPYRISTRCAVEPIARRFCVAPYDGLLESTFVEPGDIVNEGSILARMNGREIRWNLAGLQADMHRAARQRDQHVARHETTKALMADLELERLATQDELLKFRQENMAIESPISGIVLTGSLDRRENFPVSKGQVLYEVAPLDPLRLELSIPADEISRTRVGQQVTAVLDGIADRKLAGTIERIRPRSEMRDENNVFVAEVSINNTDQWIRPGMEGAAKVDADPQTVGWILFHRPWERLRAAWLW